MGIVLGQIRISMLMPIQIRIWIEIRMMPILLRSYPKLNTPLGNKIIFTYSHNIANLQCFIFLIIVKYDTIYNNLDSSELIPIRIRQNSLTVVIIYIFQC
jgi:hypothetical protein